MMSCFHDTFNAKENSSCKFVRVIILPDGVMAFGKNTVQGSFFENIVATLLG
jgi:hypothetical protein